MAESDFRNSKRFHDERFYAACAKTPFEPEEIFQAWARFSTLKANQVRRQVDLNVEEAPLTAKEREILEAYADVQRILEPTPRVIEQTGLIDFPVEVRVASETRLAFALELFRSARRKVATLRDADMTVNEHRAYAAYQAWLQAYLGTEEWTRACEQLAAETMPSVLALTDETFDEAFRGYPAPTIVYFHNNGHADAPKRSLRMEALARRIEPYGRVARVNVRLQQGLWSRFKVGFKPEPLLLFSMAGHLKSMFSADATVDEIVSWAESQLAIMRAYLTRPDKTAKLHILRGAANG
ncbi:hypothetical protein ACFPN2_32005 [Steroidobacter flavus]|uniref:Uncharacterized protein n=1 Tax=Steroidobacter flavus TaxID=1842136 RepID=A0ABV8T2U3_9GAMM